MSDATAVVVDSLGKACPIPVIDLARAIGDVEVGAELLVLADDPGAKVDIPVWCRMKGQRFVRMENAQRGWAFRVQRVT